MSLPSRVLDPAIARLSSSPGGDLFGAWDLLSSWLNGDQVFMSEQTYTTVYGEIFALAERGAANRNDLLSVAAKWAGKIRSEQTTTSHICERHFASFVGQLDTQSERYLDIDGTWAIGEPEGFLRLATNRKFWDISLLPGNSRRAGISQCSECESAPYYLSFAFDEDPVEIERQIFADRHETSYARIEHNASSLFPRLEFSNEAWAGLRSLRGREADIAPVLYEHLIALNDLAPGIWFSQTDNSTRERELRAHGVEASSDNGKTKRQKGYVKRRTFGFRNGKRTCEWHTKLQATHNRIYFDVEGDRVFVGQIHRHL